jgi:uncharacterized glyoxalase superfamily protein PhnB
MNAERRLAEPSLGFDSKGTQAMNNRSVPISTVLPHVVYQSVPEACDWLSRVFGFSEHYRYGQPVSGVQMYLGGTFIMLRGASDWLASPVQLKFGSQMLTVMVEDVDAHYSRTKREGAQIVEELHETIYGERQYGVNDLAGHRWLFSQHVRDVSPDEWGAAVVAK